MIEVAASDLETFSLEGWFVLPLGVAGLNYVHRGSRQQCIGALTNTEVREAIWDAPMLGKITWWMAEIEEEGPGVDDYVPEGGRRTMINLRVDDPNRTAFVYSSKSTGACPQ